MAATRNTKTALIVEYIDFKVVHVDRRLEARREPMRTLPELRPPASP